MGGSLERNIKQYLASWRVSVIESENMASWVRVRHSFATTGSPKLVDKEERSSSLMSSSLSLEGADPELCITLMDRGLNFRGLMHRLRSADQQWMEQFLSYGGLSAIFDALTALGQKGFSSIADALKQLECVGCVKAVMNNRFGLEFIIAQPGEGFVKKLAQGALMYIDIGSIRCWCPPCMVESMLAVLHT